MIRTKLEAQTREQLQEQIDKYLRSYPPPGYGTYVDQVTEVNGMWVATISRSRSCD
jgi:hypothetical protein